MRNLKDTIENIEKLLLGQKELLSLEEASVVTGLSKSFIYKKTASGEIPFSKPFGKLIFFDRKLLFQYLLGNPVTPGDDIEQEAINWVANKPLKGANWND